MDANKQKTNKLLIKFLLAVVVVLGFIVLTNWYIGLKQQAFLSISNDIIYEQEVKLDSIVNSFSNSSPTATSLVSDCSIKDRQRFDDLLSRLGELNRPDLVELENLFGGCAYYFATNKANKAEILGLEIEVYKNHLRAAATVDQELETKLQKVDTWLEISRLAKEQASLTNQLVLIQSDIIDLLLEYYSINSSTVQDKVSEAQEVRENIVFIDQQISDLKRGLNES